MMGSLDICMTDQCSMRCKERSTFDPAIELVLPNELLYPFRVEKTLLFSSNAKLLSLQRMQVSISELKGCPHILHILPGSFCSMNRHSVFHTTKAKER
jgi:hypothetical protein